MTLNYGHAGQCEEGNTTAPDTPKRPLSKYQTISVQIIVFYHITRRVRITLRGFRTIEPSSFRVQDVYPDPTGMHETILFSGVNPSSWIVEATPTPIPGSSPVGRTLPRPSSRGTVARKEKKEESFFVEIAVFWRRIVVDTLRRKALFSQTQRCTPVGEHMGL